jgi:phage gp16-like protein
MHSSKWDRNELYEKVWQLPLRKLAAEYGVSDVALGKVCRKLQIPLPGSGHWTKIECGHTITRPPLTEIEDLPVLVRQIREPETPILPEDSAELEKIERIAASAVPAVTKAMLAHPLIEKTKAVLSGARSNDRGILWASREVDWLDLRVSKECLTRALRMMATILHMLEQEGFKVVVEKKASESTSAIVCGEQIRFGVMERSRQVKPVVPSTTSGYIYNSIKLEPTGILSIEVWNYYSRGPQKVWRDRDGAPLEVQLTKCVAGLMRIALKERAERKAREEEELAAEKRIDEVEQELKRIEAE